MSLKQEILANEEKLLNKFSYKYKNHIQNFIGKIRMFDYDGDIVNFLNSPYLHKQKKEQFDDFHKENYLTAIDIMNNYNKDNLEYFDINKLKVGDLVNTINISAIVKNFNTQIGMYYNSEKDILILKCQIKDGVYKDGWISRNEQMRYFLQAEKYEEAYYNFKFSNKPNQICRDIIMGINTSTKVHLFYRYSKGDRYFYGGLYKPIKFSNDNKAIILNKI